ncbi:MAG: hypothetical protein ABGW85_07920, partial [Sulfurimonas sp.]
MQSILENIKYVYDITLGEFEKNENIQDYFEDTEQFYKCLERQKELLDHYIEEYAQYKGDVNKIDLEKYGQFYLQSEFPYIVLMKYLNIL